MSPYLLAPVVMLCGVYLLVRCIILLGRLIFPRVKVRFSASEARFKLKIPQSGRYVINVLIPPFTLFAGVSHFSARFTIATVPDGKVLDYRSFGRALFRAKRTDMSGKLAMPLGSFESAAPGEIIVTCDNPSTIRPKYLLEVSRYIAPLRLVCLVAATIASSLMAIGGLVISILWMNGKL